MTLELSPDQIRRYARHILLPDVGGIGQSRLLAASVAVELGDGIASEVVALAYLAGAGVGSLLVHGQALAPVTADDVTTGILIGPDDMGKTRLQAIAERVRGINDDVTVCFLTDVETADAVPLHHALFDAGGSGDVGLCPPVDDSLASGQKLAFALAVGGWRAAKTLARIIAPKGDESDPGSAQETAERAMPVAIPDALMVAMFEEARAKFPNECCGWLAGPKSSWYVDEIRQCVNVQDTGRAVVQGRSAETAFTIEGKDLYEFNHALDSERPPRVVYHSHPNGRAYFSDTDQAAALSPFGDGPAYEVQHLVVGIDRERVNEAALFAWSDEAGEYVEVARFPGIGPDRSVHRVPGG